MNPLQLFSNELQALVGKTSGAVVALEHRRGHGSGVVLTDDGHVLTNAHVVNGVNTLQVKFADDVTAEGKVVGRDTASDLAVLSTGRTGVSALPFATAHSTHVGQVVLALGHPFGFERSVSLGVVSAVDRRLHGRNGTHLEGLIQTDAAINPGNSGGPLLSVDGTIVGINTAMLPFAQGIGFAVAASTATWVSVLLRRHGTVTRRYLGVAAKSAQFSAEEATGVGQRRGVRIIEVGPKTPAAAAGLQANDTVIAVNGARIESVDELQRELAFDTAPMVNLSIWRAGERRERTIAPELRRAA